LRLFSIFLRASACVAALGTASLGFASSAAAESLLLVEVDSGRVLHAENATYPWYPASVTKLMTAYVTLRAVKERRLTLDTPLKVSAYAASQRPSKMGFQPGTLVTVDNALKMLMVKSANDVAVVLAEGVSGSVEKFSDEMNRHARQLGMTQSNFVNPNGLPADDQITSARDMAILARATIREMPEYDHYWHVPAIRFGKKVMRNYNTLIGRYEGADGMKTGFICASGFNLVASATRHGKRLIAVVFGSPSSSVRAYKAAQLLERGFSQGFLTWLTPSFGTVDRLAAIDAAPPNLREEMCGKNRKRPAAEDAEDDEPVQASNDSTIGLPTFSFSALKPPAAKPSELLGSVVVGPPVVVYTGPSKKPAAAQLASAAPSGADSDVARRAAAASVWPAPPAAAAAARTVTAAATVPIPRPRPKARPKPAKQ
jgi:D-alanyl-D-alanine carboxypeptidase